MTLGVSWTDGRTFTVPTGGSYLNKVFTAPAGWYPVFAQIYTNAQSDQQYIQVQQQVPGVDGWTGAPILTVTILSSAPTDVGCQATIWYSDQQVQRLPDYAGS